MDESRMKKIMCVTGPIDFNELGYCQCHEHIMLREGVSCQLNPAQCMDDINKSINEVIRYRSAGGHSLVDAQPGGCGRMEKDLLEISRNTNIPIIASTGFHKLSFYPHNHWIRNWDEASLLDFFLHEINKGMYKDIDHGPPKSSTCIKAGIIKAALDLEGLTPLYKKLFTAAAKAACKTDLPFMVHIEQGTDAQSLLYFLLELGLHPSRILFCHMDRTILPPDRYIHLLREGIYLEFDTIGRFKYHDDLAELKCIQHLADAGYIGRLLLSLDTTKTRMKSYTPDGIGLDYILRVFLPLLKTSGFTEEEIQQLTIENCKNIFT